MLIQVVRNILHISPCKISYIVFPFGIKGILEMIKSCHRMEEI